MAKAPGATTLSPKKIYEAKVAELRQELVKLQIDLQDSRTKVVLILAGVSGAGRGDALNTLMGWIDPRNVETISVGKPSDEEKERPLMWRYWRSLPSSGRIGIFVDSWYTRTLRDELRNQKDLTELSDELRRIRHFERLLFDSDTLVIKIWFQLSKTDQGDRLAKLEANPDTVWRVTKEQKQAHAVHERWSRTADHMLAETDRPGAHWDIVESAEAKPRNLAFAQTIVRRFRAHHRRITRTQQTPPARPKRIIALRPEGRQRLLDLPLEQHLSSKAYEEKREKWLGRLNKAVRKAAAAKRSIVFVFEGQDAAGKGGAIRRLTSAMDARDYQIIPVAKPNDEEKAHHYLWRFWRQLPRDGRVTIFDRSWYGRVLVERIEGFCQPREWKRAFAEINDFEEQLADHGTIVVKYWLQISKDEQLTRFRSREQTPYKQHKINDEDWRNRRQWSAYETAVGDMLALTDNTFAPWNLIPANNKRFARLEVLRQAAKGINAALKA
ncbi:polyphosphate:AMP phosphotransferase [Opitutaceae bacterium]|nr:polyphosphate:AMP phosphotransferase [Opitutaceae bacterium]